GYNTATTSVDIQTPGVEITGLDTSRSTASPDEPFSVGIGIATNNERSVSPQQEVRPHSTPYPLTLANGLRGVPLKVCSSNIAVGTVVGGYPDADPKCRKATVEQLHDSTDVFSFHSVGAGTTSICVYEDGVALVQTDNACRDVTVSPKTISINGRDQLGSG